MAGASHDLERVTTWVALVGVAAGSALGGLQAGVLGAALGAILGLIAALPIQWIRSHRARTTDPAAFAVDLRQVAPRKAIELMGALSDARGGASVRSEVLDALAEVARTAQVDPTAGLAAALALEQDHPRSPAVLAELARRRFALDEDALALTTLERALSSALEFGMNPMAARLFAEFSAHRDHLTLAPHLRERLARVLEHHGEAAAALWCRDRETDRDELQP